MSEGLEILGFISSRGGCILTELSVEMGIPVGSLHGWMDLLCSTGYLRRCEQDHGECPCSKNGFRCVSYRCSCAAVQTGIPIKIEVTEKGLAMVRRSSDKNQNVEVV